MTIHNRIKGQSGLPTPDSTKSFWHHEPSSKLFGHRTTAEVPSTADIVIVGSGISGTSAAWHLRENGEKGSIVMLEAREACWGATGRNGGHCQPSIYDSTGPDVAAFELRNYDALKSLVEKHDIPCEWRSYSGVHTYMSKVMFEEALFRIQALEKSSPELASTVKIITSASSNPSLTDLRISEAAGAVIQAKAAGLWPYKLISWLLEDLLRRESLNLQTNTPVTSLQKVSGGWIVHTPRGMISANKVLLCTNGYTSALLDGFSDLIVPVRGEMSSLIPPSSVKAEDTKTKALEHSYVFLGNANQSTEQDDYLIQRPFYTTSSKERGGELMFGGGRSCAAQAGVGVSDDSSVDPPAAAYLRSELNVVLDLQNENHELEASYEWSGIMGYSRDGHPWVGPVSESFGGGEGLWVCGGFTGHGMPNTWLSGAAAAGLLGGKRRDEIDLPKGYFFDMERVRKARDLDEVWLADAKAFREGV